MITISIVTWNNESTIFNCLNSILSQTVVETEIIIIDNNSKDNTVQIITNFNDSRIKLFPLTRNTGFTGGHNFALKQISKETEYILLANPDVILQPNYIEKALLIFSLYPHIGCISGLLLQNINGNPTFNIDSAGLCFSRSRRFFLRFYGKNSKDFELQRKEIFGCDGALPFYRKAMVRDLYVDYEFFDESFFCHKEDWDVSWRAQLLGWKTLFVPECIAWHVRSFRPNDPDSRKSQSTIIRIHSIKNQFFLIFKNENFNNFLFDFPFILARQIAIFFYVLTCDFKSIRAYWLVIKNFNTLIKKRKIIMQKRRISRLSLRQWLH